MTFEEIYNLYKDLVFNLSLQYNQNAEDAEEITQDVFVAVHDKLDTFENKATLKTWIYRIAVNKSLDYLKARKRIKRGGLFSLFRIDDEERSIVLPDFHHPGVQMEDKEAVAGIFSCINRLPGNQKSVIILLKIEQMTTEEASKVLNVSTKAVESLLQRAKKNLEIMLKQNEGK